MSNFDINSAAFNPELRMLETTDPAHADTFNALFGQLIRNDVAIMRAAGQFAGSKNAQAEFLLNMRKDGLKYGVHWDPFSATPSPVGTRILDNVGKVCEPSTDTVRGRNDLENTSVFYHLDVNGYVDENGDFQVEAIRGIDDTFDRFTKDTWCLFLPQWIKIEISAEGENKILSDTKFDGSFPEGGAIRPDGSIRPFVALAKYFDSSEASGTPNTVSGKAPSYNNSHNTMITKMRRKGTQYCGTTMQDWERMNNLMDVAFATRHSQSVMAGTTSYYKQYAATILEDNVERIIIAKADATFLVEGSCVSIGNATALNASNTPNNDRSYAGMHAKADRVRITKIEEYDSVNYAVYVDNGGRKFSTASTVVNGVSCPTIISTMPWWTGSCDGVLGSCGSVNDNKNGKNPYVLFGVEMFLGQYEVIGNTMMVITDGHERPYICYDSTKIATSNTSDYVAVGYEVPNSMAKDTYISEVGFDPDNPMVRMCTDNKATSSTGYADDHYTDDFTGKNGTRELLLGGSLTGGATAGRRYEHLDSSLGAAPWSCAARLSASGRCSQRAS